MPEFSRANSDDAQLPTMLARPRKTSGQHAIWGHNRPMLYKFKSKATGDLIMLEPHGRQILSLLGKDPSPRGILQVAEMPAALQALHSALVKQDERDAQARQAAQARGEETLHEDNVSLRQRAVPFIAMMQRCLDEQHDIVWGV